MFETDTCGNCKTIVGKKKSSFTLMILQQSDRCLNQVYIRAYSALIQPNSQGVDGHNYSVFDHAMILHMD